MYKNPFKPTFGSIPVSIAGREEIKKEILEGLDNTPGDPSRSALFVGARGTGKTVLMASIAEEAEKNGWISVNVTSDDHEMLKEIFVQAMDRAKHIITPSEKNRITGLQLGGFGMSLENIEQMSTWRSVLTNIVEELNENNVGLLVTIDEISPYHKDLERFVNIYQHFIRERRNVAMILAGLPNKVDMLLQDTHMTYLRRAFRYEMASIDVNDVAYSIRETVREGGREISEEALDRASELSRGYAYMIQLIGYHMWKQSEDEEITVDHVNEALSFAERDMRRTIFDATYSELSDREKEFIGHMLADSARSKTSDIAEKMGITSNNGSQIRKKLIENGVIRPSGRGYIEFDMPSFRTYLEEMQSE